jgi:putative ATP-dependent endonuclease of the OLD family
MVSSPGMNCLIGPGDSAKTTILDAIELGVSPRSYTFADLPAHFKANDRYGMHLRGWSQTKRRIVDGAGRGARRTPGRSAVNRRSD